MILTAMKIHETRYLKGDTYNKYAHLRRGLERHQRINVKRHKSNVLNNQHCCDIEKYTSKLCGL